MEMFGTSGGWSSWVSAWMIAPMMYMIQIDCHNDVLTEGDAAR
jgi:hypothetical protein